MSPAPAASPSSATAALRTAHGTLRHSLIALERCEDAGLVSALRALKPALEQNLAAKDQLYQDSAKAFERAGQPGPAQILRIFEQNMGLVSSSVRGFLASIDSAKDPRSLRDRLPTVVRVLRERMDSEERAVFPLFDRSATL
ncbi:MULTISPECIES: hemerythrin domain-containing protein [Myxococcaceae]|uniref:hemerythrin domain-containing protein n=1 Tax=Myxococcaceae TaxID=31 RepID=UPI0018907C22|nr:MULTISPECIES: hemerythrin domain-containing protein [Myxococcaceae]MBF5041550.1 hemerythrin domain-containing protein [Simulacricoccus sp. 17bor-14]